MHPQIPLFAVHMPDEVDGPLLETLHSGYIGQGKRVDEFETALSEYLGGSGVTTVNSGTSAIQLALRLCDAGPGAEVITTPMTCTATNTPILASGARVVWADVDPDTGLIDPADVERKITARTRAIVCVDWGGTPCDLDALQRIGAEHGVPIIEDAAHALGATYGGRPVGTVSDFTCFSLQAIKIITTGDGGFLTANDPAAAARARKLRWYGIDRDRPRDHFVLPDDIEEWGYKFHMNDLAATIGLVQLPHLDALVQKHRANAAFYDQELPAMFQRPPQSEGSYWMYTVLLPDARSRSRFSGWMNERGVMVSQVHGRNDQYGIFSEASEGALPGVDMFFDRMACIPVHWKLSAQEREQVVSLCREFAGEQRDSLAG